MGVAHSSTFRATQFTFEQCLLQQKYGAMSLSTVNFKRSLRKADFFLDSVFCICIISPSETHRSGDGQGVYALPPKYCTIIFPCSSAGRASDC